GDVVHHEVGLVVADHRIVHLHDMRMYEPAGEAGLVAQQPAVEPAVHRVAKHVPAQLLDRDCLPAKGVPGQMDGAGRPLADTAAQFGLAELLHRHGARQARRWRARAIAARTCAGAVPPTWSREPSEPSTVSTPNTSSLRRSAAPGTCAMAMRSSSSENCGRSQPFTSAARTASATASCASRKGRPFLTR